MSRRLAIWPRHGFRLGYNAPVTLFNLIGSPDGASLGSNNMAFSSINKFFGPFPGGGYILYPTENLWNPSTFGAPFDSNISVNGNGNDPNPATPAQFRAGIYGVLMATTGIAHYNASLKDTNGAYHQLSPAAGLATGYSNPLPAGILSAFPVVNQYYGAIQINGFRLIFDTRKLMGNDLAFIPSIDVDSSEFNGSTTVALFLSPWSYTPAPA